MFTLNTELLESGNKNSFYTTSEVCSIFGISRATLYRYMNNIELGFPRPLRLVPGKVLFRSVDIAEYINRSISTHEKEKEVLKRYRHFA